ncbi:hypothetical protein D0T60_09915 [Bacteroides sp. 224]|nr:hypothetical protein [Bacteroides sp. 224]
MEFILPSGGLNGAYHIETEEGSTVVFMEEYKLPTFEVTFDSPEESYQLGDSVEVSGKVKTFSEVSVQEAEVKYIITRDLYIWPSYGFDSELIASGTSKTNENGSFKIPVKLLPNNLERRDLVRYKKYRYTIETVVTNEAGETQVSQISLHAAEHSLLLNMSMEPNEIVNKEEPIQTIFWVENLNNQPVLVEGTYKLYSYTVYNDEKKELSATVIQKGTFTSNVTTDLSTWKALPSGAYRIKVHIKDTQGRVVEHEQDIILFSTNEQRLPIAKECWLYEQNLEFDEENPGVFVFGTSLQDTHIFMDAFCGTHRYHSEVIKLSNEMRVFKVPFSSEAYNQGVTVVLAFVKNGWFYQETVELTKRITNKKLELSWEVFRDKLRPGQKEEWKLKVKDSQGLVVPAELLALMYDASLDKIEQNDQELSVDYRFNHIIPEWNMNLADLSLQSFGNLAIDMGLISKGEQIYDTFWLHSPVYLFDKITFRARWRQPGIITEETPFSMRTAHYNTANHHQEENIPDPRTNFAETAFFYPQLRTNEQGEIAISFTMPESLTRWNFCGYAHTQDMLTGMINGTVTTSKDFMLTPNLPRFVRVGDQTSIAASVANLTEKAISGTVTLTLFDPLTDKVISTQQQKFNTQAGKTTGVNFTFSATDKYELLGCRIIAKGGNFSDGEQHVLPVLSNKEYITETVAMPIRGKETRSFSLEGLFNNQSETATERKLTVEFTSDPNWYAVQALSSMSMPTNDNAISWAAAYYTNSLAANLLNAQPKIKTVFDAWKAQNGTKETFLSNLEKNRDVKNILLEESPWLLEATSETEQMKRIATLYDLNNIQNNNITALTKLEELQLADGSWAWYKGMPGSRYITSYVVEMLARLSKQTAKDLDDDALTMLEEALDFLNRAALKEYKNIKKAEQNGNKVKGISATTLNYLYLQTISGQQVPDDNLEAFYYFIDKIKESIADFSLIDKAHAAIVLSKAKKAEDAKMFIASLKEHLVQTDEFGAYFAFNESPYNWSGLKVPAHVAVMEAMAEVGEEYHLVEEMKLWLLKQKQTQQWDSPVATVNAVYALLYFQEHNPLGNQGDAHISLDKKTIETLSSARTSIPGLSYIKEVITDNATLSNLKTAVVEKRDEGIGWGAVYAQYKEDISKVSKSGKELSVDKKLYVERISGTQKELLPVTADTQLNVGDKVIARLTIRLDRAMDFVQLKDQRGACFEPIGTASGYCREAGTGYYVAIKDASTNFFFDSLNKGVYVLEYGYRISRTGVYESGLATIQSAYAPEYSAHSSSEKIIIKK